MTDDQTTDQIDPIRDAAETLLYGDPEAAGEKLRTAIHFEAARLNAHQGRQGRLQAEHARSMRDLAKFNELNDAYQDPLVQAAGRAAMASEQYADLINAGFSVEKFKEATGRAPTEQDIFNLHLEFRATGTKGLRSTDKLLDDVASTIEEKFGVKRRITDIDRNRKDGARSMVNDRRKLRGLEPEDFGDGQPTTRVQPRDGDRPVSDTSPAEYTRQQFGFDADPAVDEAMTASRKKGFATIAAGRGANIQISRTAQDRRYPDRQAG